MTPDKNQLKTLVITGGFTGIGLETAKLLLSSGEYRIALIGRRKSKMDIASKELSQFSDLVSFHICDLANESEINSTLDKILSVNKTIYGVVNNAGIYPFGGIEDTTSQSWDEILNVNLKSAFLVTKGLLPAMVRNKKGRVINVSSTAGILPNHFALAYSVSKAAMIQFTKSIAKELGKHNITVNCICPGIVRTPMHDAYHQSKSELEEFYNRRGAAFPLGRVGEANDISGIIKFFLSDDASWITGDVLIADGGRLLI